MLRLGLTIREYLESGNDVKVLKSFLRDANCCLSGSTLVVRAVVMRWFLRLGLGALLALPLVSGVQAQSAEAGRLLYVSKTCNTCHNTPPTLAGNNNQSGANNPQAILNAINGGVSTMAGLVVSDTEATSLALFIGQKEAPRLMCSMAM